MEIVTNPTFDYVAGVAIFLNAASIGIATDLASRREAAAHGTVLQVVEWLFAICFGGELALRLMAFGCQLYRMPGWAWNVFDTLLVVMQWFDQAVSIVAASTDAPEFLAQGPSAMRIIRILRVIRIIRLVRILRLIGELRTIVICIAGSLKSLGWTVCLLFLMIYIVAVYITQVVADHRVESLRTGRQIDPQLDYFFGSLMRSILSLYEAMSGGVSWDEAVEPLMRSVSPFMGLLFSFYTAFVLLAIMNVVTGVFVETALQTAKNDKEVYMVHHAREIFSGCDKDNDGTLSWKEFQAQLTSLEMQDLFKIIGIDSSEARWLFQLLDLNETGEVSFDDFLNGCVRLRGTASSLDVMTLLYESRRRHRVFTKSLKRMQKQLMGLQTQVSYGLMRSSPSVTAA